LEEQNQPLVGIILTRLGHERTLELLKKTVEREEGGGMLTNQKPKARRTPGGCFFFIVKELCSNEERKDIFTDAKGKVSKKKVKRVQPNKHMHPNK